MLTKIVLNISTLSLPSSSSSPSFLFLKFQVSTMSTPFTVKIIEQCRVSSPPSTTPATSLPLTFLDLPWLFFPPSQPLFFYEFPNPFPHFIRTTLPKLKHSLSLTLQHYYPFAANFVPSPEPSAKPQLVSTDSNSVSLTIAESNGDFKHLCSNHPREVTHFHPLVPKLASSFSCGKKRELPLLAVQITAFPNAGICIGLAFHHVVADGRTFNNFFRTWASFCNFGASSFPLPFYDRSVITDANGLEEVFLKEWQQKSSRLVQEDMGIVREAKVDLSSMVRATFLMGASEMEKIKRLIVDCCKKKNQSQPVRLSAYVLTCAFMWVCLLKTQHSTVDENVALIHEDPTYFGFNAGGITRLDFPVPMTYLGNCVGFGRATVKRNELLGEDGIVVAAKAIGNMIERLDASIFEEAEKWVLDWEVLHGSELHVHVTWSPKLKLYESDFGWGRPKKIEEISIDSTRAFSLVQSRDVEGGMEIGIALPRNKMDTFFILFTKGLNALS